MISTVEPPKWAAFGFGVESIENASVLTWTQMVLGLGILPSNLSANHCPQVPHNKIAHTVNKY